MKKLKKTMKTGIVQAEAIDSIKFIEWVTFYNWRKNKKAGLLQPALLLPSQKTKKNVVSAQCYSRQNQHAQCLIIKQI